MYENHLKFNKDVISKYYCFCIFMKKSRHVVVFVAVEQKPADV